MSQTQVKYRYTKNIDLVYQLITDPSILRSRCEAMGDRDVHISKTENTITTARIVEGTIPSFAKKFIRPTNKVTDIKVWNPMTKSAQLFVDVEGMPIKITGDIHLIASDNECDVRFNYEVICKIPFFGSQLERYIAQMTQEGMHREFMWNQQQLEL